MEVVQVKKLTHKQEVFCMEYLIDGNGTAAAIRAGYSPDTAGAIAAENLTKPNIIEKISEERKLTMESLKIDRETQLKELDRIKLIALCNHDHKAAVQAIDIQNKLLGLYSSDHNKNKSNKDN